MRAHVGQQSFEVVETGLIKVEDDLLYGTFYAFLFAYADENIEKYRISLKNFIQVLVFNETEQRYEMLAVHRNTIKEV